MPGRALSERVKRQQFRRTENARYQEAVDAYFREQQLPEGTEKRGLRPIAAQYDVKWRTLGRLVKGGVSMSAFNASKRKLTFAEERVLVDWILASSDRAMPPTLRKIADHANGILEGRGTSYEPVGESWVGRFLDRYRDEVQTHWSRPLATERAKALNKDVVVHWYDLIKDRVVVRGIKRHNIYGMDESGFPPSDQGVQRVVGRRGAKVQHKAGSANRENVTVLVTICADGTALKPTIIFKGQHILKKWGENNISEASISATENGWTDGGLALDWIRKDFDPQTREKAAGETRVLIMDGHSSHYTADLLEYCLANNIEVYGYPPHCTHALQGLDVVCFAKMKECWKEEINAFEAIHRRGVNKEDFCEVWGRAYKKAFTKENVESAFEATGIWPFNPDVIKPAQMKPAEVTSTRTTFPLPQTSPTRAVMAAFRSYQFTEQGLHPDSPPQAGPSQFAGSLNEREGDTPLTTPIRNEIPTPTAAENTRKRRLDPASRADLVTPSKRMRLLGIGLANTESGSFLVTKARATYLDMNKLIQKPVLERVPDELPTPDWSLLDSTRPLSSYTRHELEEHCRAFSGSLGHAKTRMVAQELILEGQGAQLIVQNMGMEQMNLTLLAKEKAKQTDRSVLFPGGKGRHLTDPELIAEKRRLENEKREKELAKEQRKAAKANKKASKQQLDERWKDVCRLHDEAVAAWEAECLRLRAGGATVKDLPKKPKRVLKASLVEKEAAEESDEDDEESGDDD